MSLPIPIETLLGALVGLVVGLTGVGGGSLMMPLLVLTVGVAPLPAVGTDLWFAAITKLAAGPILQRRRLIDWSVVGTLWAGSLPASAAGIGYLAWHRERPVPGVLMLYFIAGAITLSSAFVLWQAVSPPKVEPLRADGVRVERSNVALLTVGAGALLGLLVTFTSVGAGAIGASLLSLLYPRRLTPARLVASDIAHAVPLAFFAGIGHLIIGDVRPVLLGLLLMGSIPAVMVGSLISTWFPPRGLRIALALVLLGVALRILLHPH
jgi:hypothetical protein